MTISSHTTAELAAELVRRGTSYAGNCTLTSWNNGPKGMTFGFKADTKDGEDIILHAHPFEGCYVGKDGDRFFVMAYPIPNDAPQEDTQIIAESPKRRYNELKYVERAGILASDTDFQVFARVKAGAVIWDSKIYYGYKTSELAAAYIRTQCGVASRRDIDGNPEAIEKFNAMYNSFTHWRDYGRGR